jgi:hypothetical protein
MKAKLKGANGFVRFLLQHGEKIGIAAILLVAGMLIWSSLGRPVVDDTRQPPALTTEANAAKTNVETMSWESFPEGDRTDFTRFSSRSGDLVSAPVEPTNYPPMDKIDPPIIPPIKFREDPVLVAAADLEVRPGAGLWMSSNPEAILANMREAAKEAAKERQEAEEEARRMEEEAEEGRGRGRGGEGGFGRGGFGEGGRGGMGMGDMSGMKTKDGVLVVPPTGGAQMQGFEEFLEESWVTVLAKIPFKQQIQMYEDALATARGFNPTIDQPQYLGYEVERAEVTDEGTGKFTLLRRVFPKVILDEMATYPIQTPDLVNPKYIHPLLTHPLPPMVMREWGEEITHSDLPLPTPEDLMGGTESEETKPVDPKDAEIDPDDPFGSVARRQTQPGMAMGRGGEMGMGRPMGMPMGRGGEMGMGRPMGMPMGRGGEMGMGRPMGGGMPGAGGEQQPLPEYVWDGVTKTLLFRFFDDTVQPGHRYQYRVRLVLKDVNVDQPAKYLDPTVTARQTKTKLRYRMTDWSDPSPVAVVPRPGLTFIAQTKDVNSPEPEARLIVKSVDSEHAAEIAADEWYTRGSVLNFAGKAKIIWSSLYKVDPEEPQDSPDFKFLTGMTLVDLDGGDQLVSKNRELMAPARALVMDSSGRLSTANELKQSKTIREYDFIMEQDAEAERRARMNEDDRGPGGRGGGGRRGGF